MDGAYRGLNSHVKFGGLEQILVVEFQFLCLGFDLLIIAKDQILVVASIRVHPLVQYLVRTFLVFTLEARLITKREIVVIVNAYIVEGSLTYDYICIVKTQDLHLLIIITVIVC